MEKYITNIKEFIIFLIEKFDICDWQESESYTARYWYTTYIDEIKVECNSHFDNSNIHGYYISLEIYYYGIHVSISTFNNDENDELFELESLLRGDHTYQKKRKRTDNGIKRQCDVINTDIKKQDLVINSTIYKTLKTTIYGK